MKKTVTLLELIMAIALTGVVILGITSFDIGSRKFLQASEHKTQVLNEATLIMDRISKDALMAVGNRNAPAMACDGVTLTINQDLDNDGIADAVVSYRVVNNQIQRSIATANEMITNPDRQVVRFEPAFIPIPAVTNTAQVRLTLRFDRLHDQNAFDNPEVQLQSNIIAPGWSLN